MSGVPTIDMRHVDEAALKSIDRACRDHGFFKVVGHRLNDLMDEMWRQTAAFFALPIEYKSSLIRPEDSAFGYFNREMTKLKRDKKETFDYHGHSEKVDDGEARNFWPQDVDGILTNAGIADFEAVLKDYYAANAKLSEKILRIVLAALGQEPTGLDFMFGDKHTTLARLNHYPPYDPLPASEHTPENELGDMALHHHTDPGAITLLYQDNVGGLQAKSRTEGWIDVPPEAHSFVLNLGDLMQVWSNDRYTAAEHRVLPVPSGTSRYSMPFFFSPRYSSVIEPIVIGEKPKYRSFSWFEFAKARTDDNYGGLDREDIQVTDYRLSA